MTAFVNSDTVALVENERNVIVLERGRELKDIILIKDTSIDTVSLKPKWSRVYNLNFFSFGSGFLIDWRTSKKWVYPSVVYLSDRWIEEHNFSNMRVYNKYAGKGIVNFRFSIPYLNLFHFTNTVNNESKSKSGFLGLSAGIDYFYSDRMFLNISGSGIMNSCIPVPVGVDYAGVQDHMYSIYASLSNNHMLFKNRFSYGYGVSYGKDSWKTIDHGRWRRPERNEEDLIDHKDTYRKSNSLGIILSSYYYTKRSFYMGFVYRPMFLQFADNTRFQYQYTASFDMGWRIRLVK